MCDDIIRGLEANGEVLSPAVTQELLRLASENERLRSSAGEFAELKEKLEQGLASLEKAKLAVPDPPAPGTIRVAVTNPQPANGATDPVPILALWEEVQSYFSDFHYPQPVWEEFEDARISLDARDTIEEIRTGWIALEEYQHRIFRSWDLGYHSYIDLSFQGIPTSVPEHQVLSFSARFLQELFLTMNLAVPGSCTLYRASFLNTTIDYAPTVDLTAYLLEDAVVLSREWKWPPITALPFETVWRWVQRKPHSMHTTDIASTSVQKSFFALLRIAERTDAADHETVLLIAQILESFFVDRTEGIVGILRERIDEVLGAPQSHKRWLTKFYDLRSRIAHGSSPMLRPGEMFDWDKKENIEFFHSYLDPVRRSIAVLLAVLQDLIVTDSDEYTFRQIVDKRRLD